MESIIGFDVGTGNLCSAVQNKDEVELKLMRNSFITVSPEDLAISEVAETNLQYVEQKNDDGELEYVAIIGEDAFRLSNIFNRPVRRPMKKGVISSVDIDAIDVVGKMCQLLIPSEGGDLCVYSVPAMSVDDEMPPVEYHEQVFGNIFTALGFKETKALNEGMAVIFSECKNTNFTGIGVSCGAGLINVAMSYKGTPVIQFSVSRSGDWLDESVAKSLNLLPNKVTHIKETKLDLSKSPTSKNKQEKRVLEALTMYYKSLMTYVFKTFVEEFNKISDGLELSESIPIIISGGTSKPEGLIEIVEDILLNTSNFPYEISEIRKASDPLTSVAKGCLIYGHWLKKQSNK